MIRRRRLADYVGLVQALGLYPGSPVIVRALCGPTTDWRAASDIPEDDAALRRMFHATARLACTFGTDGRHSARCCRRRRRRGLVLIDPPFEDPEEFADWRVGWRRPCAVPHRGVRRLVSDQAACASAAIADGLREAASAMSVAVELLLREPVDPGAAEWLRHAGDQPAVSL